MEQFEISELSYLETEEKLQNQSSRNILETILEETSSDEDGIQDIWSTFDELSSDVESVIQIYSNQDQDSISERDFICPAKRRKHENTDQHTLDKINKTNIVKTEKRDDLNAAIKIDDKRLRFDEFGLSEHSESDLSFTSISRTSSLTLFESLERQMQIENQHCGSLPSLSTISTIVQCETEQAIDCLESYDYSSEDSSGNSETRSCVSFGALTTSSFVFTTNKIAENIPYNKLYGNNDFFFNEIENDIVYSNLENTNFNNISNVSFYEDGGKIENYFELISTKRLSASTPNLNHEKLSEYKNFKMNFLKGNAKNSSYIQRIMELNDGANYEYLLMSSVPENLNLCFINSNQCDTSLSNDKYKYKYFNDISYHDPCLAYKSTNNKTSNKSNWNKKTASYANLTNLNYSDESLNNFNTNEDLETLYRKKNKETENYLYDENESSNCNENSMLNNKMLSTKVYKTQLKKISEDRENFLVDENKLEEENFIFKKKHNPSQRLVSSTPNLFQCQVNYNLNELFPESKIVNSQIFKSLSKIALNQPSDPPKHGFSNKGVSFHPIVSEIIWKETQQNSKCIKSAVKKINALSNTNIIDMNDPIKDIDENCLKYNQMEQIPFKSMPDEVPEQKDKVEISVINNEENINSYIHQQKISKTSNEYKKKGFLSRLSIGLRFSIRKKLLKRNSKNNKQSMSSEYNDNNVNSKHNNIVKNDYENNTSTNGSQSFTDDISKKENYSKNQTFQNIHKHNESYLSGDKGIEIIQSKNCLKNQQNYLDLKQKNSRINLNKFTIGNNIRGLIETNLDTDETMINGKTRSLVDLGDSVGCSTIYNKKIFNNKNTNNNNNSKVNHSPNKKIRGRRPHKSMEYLLDKENHRCAMPPENELQKSHDNNTTLSEHQIRVQASLQKLNVPDWYKQYNKLTNQNSIITQGTGISKTKNNEIGRWTGLNTKTTSLSSLGSHRSDRNPIILSPSVYSHQGQPGFSRWSTLCLNSNQISPSVSSRSSFSRGALNASNSSYASVSRTKQNMQKNGSVRQPYLGWRSQEKVSQPRTPAERLASTILSEQKNMQPVEPLEVSNEIHSSIKEVTSAIVHYVNDKTQQTRSRSISPNSRIWLESSFVGTRLESPQTPTMASPSVSQTKCKTKIQKLTELTINSKDNEIGYLA